MHLVNVPTKKKTANNSVMRKGEMSTILRIFLRIKLWVNWDTKQPE